MSSQSIQQPQREPIPMALDHALKQEILRRRAEQLAKEDQPSALEPPLQVVEFQLAAEKYAIETTAIREVLPLKEMTPVPGTPAFIAGIINLRGEIVSVVDLRNFFALPGDGKPNEPRVVIIQNSRMEFGLLVDAVRGTRLISASEIQPLFSTASGTRAHCVSGLTRDATLILDANKLLSDPQLVIDDDVEVERRQNGL